MKKSLIIFLSICMFLTQVAGATFTPVAWDVLDSDALTAGTEPNWGKSSGVEVETINEKTGIVSKLITAGIQKTFDPAFTGDETGATSVETDKRNWGYIHTKSNIKAENAENYTLTFKHQMGQGMYDMVHGGVYVYMRSTSLGSYLDNRFAIMLRRNYQGKVQIGIKPATSGAASSASWLDVTDSSIDMLDCSIRVTDSFATDTIRVYVTDTEGEYKYVGAYLLDTANSSATLRAADGQSLTVTGYDNAFSTAESRPAILLNEYSGMISGVVLSCNDTIASETYEYDFEDEGYLEDWERSISAGATTMFAPNEEGKLVPGNNWSMINYKNDVISGKTNILAFDIQDLDPTPDVTTDDWMPLGVVLRHKNPYEWFNGKSSQTGMYLMFNKNRLGLRNESTAYNTENGYSFVEVDVDFTNETRVIIKDAVKSDIIGVYVQDTAETKEPELIAYITAKEQNVDGTVTPCFSLYSLKGGSVENYPIRADRYSKATFRPVFMTSNAPGHYTIDNVKITVDNEKLAKINITDGKPVIKQIGGNDYFAIAALEVPGDAQAEIYYTLDGSDPATSGKLYTNELLITESGTELKAVAKLDEAAFSEVVFKTYEFKTFEYAAEELVYEEVVAGKGDWYVTGNTTGMDALYYNEDGSVSFLGKNVDGMGVDGVVSNTIYTEETAPVLIAEFDVRDMVNNQRHQAFFFGMRYSGFFSGTIQTSTEVCFVKFDGTTIALSNAANWGGASTYVETGVDFDADAVGKWQHMKFVDDKVNNVIYIFGDGKLIATITFKTTTKAGDTAVLTTAGGNVLTKTYNNTVPTQGQFYMGQAYTNGYFKNVIVHTGNYVPKYDVNFDVGEHGSTADRTNWISVDKYTEIIEPEVEVETGYIFKGWNKEVGPALKNVTYVAQYEPVPEKINLEYGDCYSVYGAEIVSQKVSSMGAELGDTAVIELTDDNRIRAVGLGTAVIEVGGAQINVAVSKADITVVMIAGQSNAAGAEGHSMQAPKAVGEYEGRYLVTNGNDATLDASKVTIENAVYCAENGGRMPGYSGVGSGGFACALARKLSDLWDMKVWVINAALGGSRMDQWIPGERLYTNFIAYANMAHSEIENDGHYILDADKQGYVWLQGCSDGIPGLNTSAEKYIEMFTAMHEGFKAETDMRYAGLYMVRAGVISVEEYRADDFHMTGPRLAQHIMANSKDYPDIHLIFNTDIWRFDADVKAYFENKYGSAEAFQEIWGYAMPTTTKEIKPRIHYHQPGYNELGDEGAINLVNILAGKGKTTSAKLLNYYGNELEESTTIQAGEEFLAIPVAKNISYNASENLTVVTGNSRIAAADGFTVKGIANGTTSLKVLNGDTVVATYSVTVEGGESAILLGDADGNGKVNVNDAVYILKIVAKTIAAPEGIEDVADVTGEGKVNISDAVKVLKYVARVIDSLE